MSRYLIELYLDGYETDEEARKAEIEFIEEQLNFSGSSVKILKVYKDGEDE